MEVHLDDRIPDVLGEAYVGELIKSCNKAKVLKEIAKCVPMCSNCHAKLHWKEFTELEVELNKLVDV